MRPTTGIVALLDILGYKSFLAHTKVETAAKLINETLLTIPQDTADLLHKAVRNTPVPLLDRIQNHAELLELMIRLVFADTILIAHPLTPTRNPVEFTGEMLPFLATVSLLMRRFFDSGLPLRGGIALSEFVIESYCFAGDAIVKAYEAGRELEFAGCAFEDETRRAIVGAVTHAEQLKKGAAPPYRRLTFAANVPCKGGSAARFLVRWINPFVEWGDYPQDIESYVAQAFSAHGKSVDDRAQRKLKNTISVLSTLMAFANQKAGQQATPADAARAARRGKTSSSTLPVTNVINCGAAERRAVRVQKSAVKPKIVTDEANVLTCLRVYERKKAVSKEG